MTKRALGHSAGFSIVHVVLLWQVVYLVIGIHVTLSIGYRSANSVYFGKLIFLLYSSV